MANYKSCKICFVTTIYGQCNVFLHTKFVIWLKTLFYEHAKVSLVLLNLLLHVHTNRKHNNKGIRQQPIALGLIKNTLLHYMKHGFCNDLQTIHVCACVHLQHNLATFGSPTFHNKH
jgi:hypothetical protein